jgi:hypothetical protein
MKSPLRTCLHYLAPLLTVGCATTATQQAPPAAKAFEPKTAKFTAAALTIASDEWVGSYNGKVDFYNSALENWQKDSPISLIIQPEEEGGLRLLGHVMLTAGRRSFYIGDITKPPGNTIAGAYTDSNSLSTTRYVYTLNLSDSFITGTVKTFISQGATELFQPADEWRFDAKRSIGLAPR